MKNLINFKSIPIQRYAIMGLLFFTSSYAETKPLDSLEISKKVNITNLATNGKTIMVIKNDDDAKFLMEATEIQMENIRLGKLATEKGSAPHVKALGKMMEEDHTKSLQELRSLAKAKSVSTPTTATQNSMEVFKDLNGKTGNDFDMAFSKLMVEQHEDAIALYEKVVSDTDDTAIKTWASEMLPGLRKHLKIAEESKEKCEAAKS